MTKTYQLRKVIEAAREWLSERQPLEISQQ